MDTVGPPDHRRASVLERAGPDGVSELAETGQDDVARLAHLDRLRRVDDV